jgi:4-amino-4-deoxy-L-arabinose transferase-like glycosyltransferase
LKKINLKKWLSWAIALLIISWFTPFILQSFLPNSDWDGAAYHLPLAKHLLDGRIYEVTPSFENYSFPGAVHLVYAFFFAIKAESAIIPLNLLTAIGIILVVYSLAHYIWNKKIALWAAVVCSGINLLWEISLSPRIDSFLTFFFLLACFAFFIFVERKTKTELLIIIGMMLGITIGIKYTAMLFIAVLIPISLFHAIYAFRKQLRLIILPLILSFLTLAIPSGFWYTRNTLKLGNPIYPYLSGPFFYSTDGNRDNFSEGLNELLKNMPSKTEIKRVADQYELYFLYTDTPITKTPRNLFNLFDIFQHPNRYQRKPYQELSLLILLFFLLPFFSRKPQSLRLFVIAIVLYALIGSLTYILRFSLPVLPLFSIGSAVVLGHIRSRTILNVFVLLAILTFIRFTYFEWSKLNRIQPLAYFQGDENRIEWLSHTGYNFIQNTPPLINFINERIELGLMNKDDILFMVGESKGNLLKCDYKPDASRQGNPWLVELIKTKTDYEKIAQDFKKQGVNHLVINLGYLQEMPERYEVRREPLVFGLYHLLNFLRNYTEVLYNENGLILAKLH